MSNSVGIVVAVDVGGGGGGDAAVSDAAVVGDVGLDVGLDVADDVIVIATPSS